MRVFVRLSKEERELIFSKLKSLTNGSWERVYDDLKIGRTMFFNYRSGKFDIPKEILEDIKEKTKMELKSEFWITKEKYLEKEISKLEMNSELGEIFGILNGDGHISKTTHEISVVGNKLEEEYANYVQVLFKRNFKLEFTKCFNENSFKVRAYSKKLTKELNDKYGLPLGKKLGQLKIPEIVYKNKQWLYAYIRGLFDTDGGFFIRRKKEGMLHITSADPKYLKEVAAALVSIGFAIYLGREKVIIYDKKSIYKFFEKIKPANTKHLKKYKEFLKLNHALVV